VHFRGRSLYPLPPGRGVFAADVARLVYRRRRRFGENWLRRLSDRVLPSLYELPIGGSERHLAAWADAASGVSADVMSALGQANLSS
jgi:hypothetical protein